jgi:hypothetical protein
MPDPAILEVHEGRRRQIPSKRKLNDYQRAEAIKSRAAGTAGP